LSYLQTLPRHSYATTSAPPRQWDFLLRPPSYPERRKERAVLFGPTRKKYSSRTVFVSCTSHQSNLSAASCYRSPCLTKENLIFRSRSDGAPDAAPPVPRATALPGALFYLGSTNLYAFQRLASGFRPPKPNRKSGIRIRRKSKEIRQLQISNRKYSAFSYQRASRRNLRGAPLYPLLATRHRIPNRDTRHFRI
jgi:hypothetical protein